MWSVRPWVLFVAAACLVVVTLAPASTTAAGAYDHDVFAYFMNDPKPTMTPPTGTTDKIKNLCLTTVSSASQPVCQPGNGISSIVDLGAIETVPTGPGGATSSSDVLVSLWLSSAGADLPVRRICLQFYSGSSTRALGCANEAVLRDSHGDPLVLTDTPQHVLLNFVNPKLVYPKETKPGIKIGIETVGADNANTPVPRLHFGSAAHASGYFTTFNNPVVGSKLGGLFRLSLTETGMAPGYPTDATDKVRAIATDRQGEAKVAWGEFTVDRAYKFLSDMTFNATLMGVDQNVAVGAAAFLTVNGVTYNASTNVEAAATAATLIWPHIDACNPTCAKIRFGAGFPTAGVSIPAGSKIKLELVIHGLGKTEQYNVVFGSTANPSGLLAVIAGASGGGGGGSGGGSGPTTSSSATTTSSASTNSTSSSTTTGTSSTTSSTGTTSTGDNATGTAAEGDSAQSAHAKDIGQPMNAVPNLTAAAALAAAALGLALVRRRRE